MTNGNGITIKAKDLGIIIILATIIIGSIVDSALTRAKVAEHDAKFKAYPPSVIYTNQVNMAEDIVEIKDGMKQILNIIRE